MRGDGMLNGNCLDCGEPLFERLEGRRDQLELDFLAGALDDELDSLESEFLDECVRGERETSGLELESLGTGRLKERMRFAVALADLADGRFSGRTQWFDSTRELVFLVVAGASHLLARFVGGASFFG